jgi:hypothetical protein
MLSKLLFGGILAVATISFAQQEFVTWLTPVEHDFGDIEQDVDVVHEFRFVNETEEPLLIDNVRMGCGCTTSDWSAVPVAPDSTGVLKVTYDARNDGYFRKYVKVYFNGHRRAEKLWLEGYVVK